MNAKQMKIHSNSELIERLLKIDLDKIARGKKGNEENIKIIVVVPLLEILGYEKENMDFEFNPLLENSNFTSHKFMDKIIEKYSDHKKDILRRLDSSN